MDEHWQMRRRRAVESSSSAENAKDRETYLRVAEHYRSLEQWCSGPAPRALARLAKERV